MPEDSSAPRHSTIPRQDAMAPEALQRDLLQLLFDNLQRSMQAVVIVATGLAAGLWSHAGKGALIGWWTLVVLIALARIRQGHRWRRRPDYRPPHLWQRSFRWGALAMAFAWSATVPLFMWNAAPTQQLFIAFVLAGITAGAIPSLAVDLRLVLFYPYALMLPVALVLLVRTGGVGPAMGALILVYLVMITSVALDYHRALRGSIADRYALAEKERETRRLFEHVPTGVFYYDRDLRLRDCNGAFTETVEAAREQLIGLDMHELRDPRILPTLETPIREGRPAHYEGFYVTHFSGIEKWGDIHVAPIFDGQGKVRGAIGAVQDRTREHQALVQLERMALHDPLTGLPNRKLLQEHLRHCLAEIPRTRELAALLYLDLDDFKRINDTLGHEAGDRLLQAFADRVRPILRAGDTCARLGGDEFVILATGLGRSHEDVLHHGLRIADKIHALCREPFDVGDRPAYTTASIGLVIVEAGSSPQELLRRADMAMYRAKADGRGQSAFYDERMDREAREYARLVQHLRRAVEKEDFTLVYQPIVRLHDGRMQGAEVLLRWRDPVLGEIPPARFVAVAEETSLIEPIGRWTLDRACRQYAEWREAGILDGGEYLSLNVSLRELRSRDYPAHLQAVLARHGLPPSSLRLEITETLLAEDLEALVETLQGFREQGVHCMLDDFGTGYSSLNYLKRLPVSAIKVDREFIRDLTTDTEDATLVRAMVDIAQHFGCEAVAEGVETERQRKLLLAMSPELLGQGRLFSPPLRARELAAWRERHRTEMRLVH